MSIKILRSIPHELRAFQWDGATMYPWISTIYGDGSASLRYHIDGCHDDNENSGCYEIYNGDWIVLDENDEPVQVIQYDISERYTVHEP